MKKVIAWILSLFGSFQKEYEKFQPIAKKIVEYINTVKAGIESGTLDSLAALTPSDKDDAAILKIKKTFSDIASQAAVVEGLVSVNINGVDALTALAKHLSEKSSSARLKFWVSLSGQLMSTISDGKLTIAEAIALTQLVYSQLKK